MKKKLKIIFRVGVSCVFLGCLSFKVNWNNILVAFKEIDVNLYVLSTLLAVVSSLVLACKYHLLIRETSISRSIPSLLKINLIGRFYALFLPSAVGPAAVRWYKVTRNQRGRAFFLAASVFERLTMFFVLLIVGLFPLFFYSSY